jgi:hypothetical protein
MNILYRVYFFYEVIYMLEEIYTVVRMKIYE